MPLNPVSIFPGQDQVDVQNHGDRVFPQPLPGSRERLRHHIMHTGRHVHHMAGGR